MDGQLKKAGTNQCAGLGRFTQQSEDFIE